MHEPVEILSPSRRCPSLSTLFRTLFLFFSLFFFSFFILLVLLFIFPFAAACLSLLAPPATLYSRGAKLLVTFEFNFRTQRRCRKTFTSYKGSGRWKGANCGLKKERKKKRKSSLEKREIERRNAYASDHKTRDGKCYCQMFFFCKM